MVARSPPKDACQVFGKMSGQSAQVRETVKKVDRAMARLQELQSTVRGFKVRSGLTSSPCSTRGDMHTSLGSEQELRIKESKKRASVASNGREGEWRRWSLSATLVQQAIGEILEASNFAKDIVNIVSDSMANKVMQDPKTPESAFNGTNMVEERRRKDVSLDLNIGSVQRKNYRYNAQGFKYKLNHNLSNLSNSEFRNIKAAQPLVETPPGKRQSLISHLQEEGLDDKCFLNSIGRSEQGNQERKLTSNRSKKAVYKFRIVTPENKVKALSPLTTSSSLELRRKAEKQQLRAKARVELSQAGARVRSQMNFRASDCANDCGKSVKALASALVSCCTSPARSIDEQKPLVTVDQITPVRKPWISHHKPTKTIMFPNPAFVPSPSDVRSNSGNLCKKTRSLSYQKGFVDTPKYKQYSFLGKENVSVSRKMATTGRPSYNISATKVPKRYCLSKVPIRTPMRTPLTMVKQSPIVKAFATAKNNSPSSVKTETPLKFSKLFSPAKKRSPKHLSSSRKTVWFHRSNNDALSSDLGPVTCNLSLLSKQLNDSPMKPLPSLISKLPSRRKRIFTPMCDAQHDMKKEAEQQSPKEVIPNKFESGVSVSAKILPLPPAWGSTMPVVSIKDSFLKPSNLNCFHLYANEMPCQSSGRSISCPKQRLLKPVENNMNVDSTVNRISIVKASGTEFSARRKGQHSEGKDNKVDSKEEGHGSFLKKANGPLRRSWSFGHEKVSLLNNAKLNNNAGGGLPFLKYVRGFINMQKGASNIHG